MQRRLHYSCLVITPDIHCWLVADASCAELNHRAIHWQSIALAAHAPPPSRYSFTPATSPTTPWHFAAFTSAAHDVLFGRQAGTVGHWLLGAQLLQLFLAMCMAQSRIVAYSTHPTCAIRVAPGCKRAFRGQADEQARLKFNTSTVAETVFV